MVSKNQCAAGALANCNLALTSGQVATPGTGPFYFVYILADPGGLPSLGGIQLGISYDGDVPGPTVNGHGVDIFYFALCANLELNTPGWPASGTGSLLIWNFNGHPAPRRPRPWPATFTWAPTRPIGCGSSRAP